MPILSIYINLLWIFQVSLAWFFNNLHNFQFHRGFDDFHVIFDLFVIFEYSWLLFNNRNISRENNYFLLFSINILSIEYLKFIYIYRRVHVGFWIQWSQNFCNSPQKNIRIALAYICLTCLRLFCEKTVETHGCNCFSSRNTRVHYPYKYVNTSISSINR